jgi:hypothetical protein
MRKLFFSLLLFAFGCTSEIGSSTLALDDCPEGFRRVGRICDPIPPRLVAPIAGSRTGDLVEFRWELARGTTGGWIEVCTDYPCTSIVLRQEVTGSSTRVRVPVGRNFWRMRGKVRFTDGIHPTPPWPIMAVPGFPLFAAPTPDFDGDWYADVAIGTFGSNDVHVYAGSAAGVGAIPDLTIVGPTGSADFGLRVASGGDLDGDGFGDLLVGAPASLSGSSGVAPRVYAYLGSASGLASAPVSTLSGSAGSVFGLALAGGVDVNHDGYADAVVGSPAFGVTKTGKVDLFLGGPGGLSTSPAKTWLGTGVVNSNFGAALAFADVNDDSLPDLVVGEANAGFLLTGVPGRVHVFHATATSISSTANVVLGCPDGNFAAFGFALANAGDWDWDGDADVVVGAPGLNGLDGRVYVFGGSATGLQTTPIATFSPSAAGQAGYFGYFVDGAADVDFDHHPDIAIGETDVNALRGRVTVLYGPVPGAPARPRTAIENPFPGTGGYFGAATAIAGDLNGDQRDDLVAGASYADGDVGAAAVYYGAFHAAMPTTPGVTMIGPGGPGGYFGYAITN